MCLRKHTCFLRNRAYHSCREGSGSRGYCCWGGGCNGCCWLLLLALDTLLKGAGRHRVLTILASSCRKMIVSSHTTPRSRSCRQETCMQVMSVRPSSHETGAQHSQL